MILSWLVPGLGHWYQGRRAKAVIFFVCILSSFYYGLYLGGGRVVYASWNASEHRLHILSQAFVGLPTAPAFIQARRFGFYNLGKDDSLRQRALLAAQARLPGPIGPVTDDDKQTRLLDRLARNEGSFWNWFMAPPVVKLSENGSDTPDELDLLHKNLNRYFELGSIYTTIAGLLNVLVMYDAWGGPAFSYWSARFFPRPKP